MTVTISTIPEVLERLRIEVVAQLRAIPVSIPSDASAPGGCASALRAWFRLHHRSVPRAPRRVSYSTELRSRVLPTDVHAAVKTIEDESLRGDDHTHRMTRQFYKSAFNDFLFNNFGIHHLHLGLAGGARDATRRHSMCGGRDELLFAIVKRADIYFVDLLDHDVFDDAALTKSLLRTTVTNWPDVLPRLPPDVLSVEPDFETAYELAKAGFTTVFDVDGVFLHSGGQVRDGVVRDGRRSSCTTADVVRAANSIMNRVAEFVRAATSHRDGLAREVGALSGREVERLELEVVRIDGVVTAEEKQTGVFMEYDGTAFHCRVAHPVGRAPQPTAPVQ